ncbi:hypothetical protein T492DRAFT_850832 [Pavlovales sp. CCMP2436]|nr:hypothetical protein T492DRAFT_850832 [Pavlovales sp. CCMP2436]
MGGFQTPWWCRWRAPDGAARESIVFAERGRLVCVEPGDKIGPASPRRVLYETADEGAGQPFLLYVVARGAQAIALLQSRADLVVLSPSPRADVPCLLGASSKVAPRVDAVQLEAALPRGERVAFVGAFFFSPGGRWLLVLVRTSRAAAAAGVAGAVGTEQWRWVVYDCEERAIFGATPGCELSPALAQQYVPFFTQYAQSVSPFSPDGGAFCYVTDEGGFVATLHPERTELAARVTVTTLPNKPARPDVMWWSGPVSDAVDDVEIELHDRRW